MFRDQRWSFSRIQTPTISLYSTSVASHGSLLCHIISCVGGRSRSDHRRVYKLSSHIIIILSLFVVVCFLLLIILLIINFIINNIILVLTTLTNYNNIRGRKNNGKKPLFILLYSIDDSPTTTL